MTVRLFAGHRERAGTAEVELELPDGATVSDLAEDVLRRYPAITRDPASLVVAVNQEYRDHDYVLRNGDEVGLIPPVSGGGLWELGGIRPTWVEVNRTQSGPTMLRSSPDSSGSIAPTRRGVSEGMSGGNNNAGVGVGHQ